MSKKIRPSRRKTFVPLIIAAVFLFFLAAVFFYFYIVKPTSGIFLDFKVPEKVVAGEEFKLQFLFLNESSNLLENTEISLHLPHGVYFKDAEGEARRKTLSLGQVSIGSVYKDYFELVILDIFEKEKEKEFTLEATYFPALFSRKFTLNEKFKVSIKTPFEVDIAAPEQVFSGENFEWVFFCKNNSSKDIEVALELVAPKEFSSDFQETTLKIKAGEEAKLNFKGNIILPENSFFDINLKAKSKFNGQEYLLLETTANLKIAFSPLSFKFFLAEKEDSFVFPGEVLNYNLVLKNNAEISFTDLIIKTSLEGRMYDFDSLKLEEGVFDSASKTIIFNPSDIPELKELEPGETKNLGFSINVISDYPVKDISDKNFELLAVSRVESPTVPYFIQANKTVNVVVLNLKVKGNLRVDSQAFFRDAPSGILNDGPFPPLVDIPTNFTVHWLVYNYLTDVNNIEIKAKLEPKVNFTNTTVVTIGTLDFNSETNEVIWRIPRVLANSGIINEPIKAIFQIQATPSIESLNYFMPLLSETIILGYDEFTGLNLTGFDYALTTNLTDDLTIKPLEGLIKQ
ncbi:MAG: hypothetical protein KY053_00155 [Candidatus Liptonbacteria bacterium]|nr:hypothetical protein [Candidatus Liptonbacteria bacterium]